MLYWLCKHLRKYTFAYFVTLLFAMLLLVNLFFHEMYADEMQAWAIAKNSETVVDLVQNLQHENNPGIWHLILFIVTKLTGSPEIQKFINGMIMITAIFLLNRFSPLSKTEKILSSFGYFLFYEYGTISRYYSLTVLLLFVVCFLYKYRAAHLYALCVSIFLLALTSPYGAILSSAFLGILFAEDIGNTLKTKQKKFSICQFNKLSSYTIAVIGVFFSLLLSVPPKDNLRGDMANVTQYDKNRFVMAISDVWESYVPIPEHKITFWNSNFLDTSLRFFPSILLIIYASAYFRRDKKTLLFYYLGTFFLLLFGYTQFVGLVRHSGHLFLVFLCALWLGRTQFDSKGDSRLSKGVLLVLLAVQLYSAIFASIMDFKYDFAAAKVASAYIRDNFTSNYFLVGDVEPISINVAQYLGKDMYFPHNEEFMEFIVWRKDSTPDKTPNAFVENAKKKSDTFEGNTEEILFVMYSPTFLSKSDADIEYLDYFGPTITNHDVYLYRLVR